MAAMPVTGQVERDVRWLPVQRDPDSAGYR
jgi:hypothetical protein